MTDWELTRLLGSTHALIAHLDHCDVCREAGIRYCTEVRDLCAITQSDRRDLLPHGV